MEEVSFLKVEKAERLGADRWGRKTVFVWREYGEKLTFAWRVACGLIGENGRIFGGPEWHLGIVGAPTLN